MRVFVHEFVTSGALGNEALPPSLLREGMAMRRAVVLELLELDGVEVVTTRAARAPAWELPGLEEVVAHGARSEATMFRSLCRESDRSLMIAPEIDGELLRRVTLAAELAGEKRVLNSPGLVEVASDKWETYLRLRRAGVPTIETQLASSDEWHEWERPVIKPRDGAGSQGVRRMNGRRRPSVGREWLGRETGHKVSRETRHNVSREPGHNEPGTGHDSIVQPFIDGRWLSCGVMFRSGGGFDVFPPAEQRIADDGTFAYLGGMMPADCDGERVQKLALQAIRSVTDDRIHLVGSVGVDLVADRVSGDLMVCEINPRFTTSFVGAKELAETNLLAGLLSPDVEPVFWTAGRVVFSADGIVTRDSPVWVADQRERV